MNKSVRQTNKQTNKRKGLAANTQGKKKSSINVYPLLVSGFEK